MRNKTLLIIILFFILGLTSVYAKSYSTLQEYENSIDYSCQTDSDCAIKDVHTCCGYDPACTNKNAVVDATFVSDACEKEGAVGICGFPSIDSCKCENNKCKGNGEIAIPICGNGICEEGEANDPGGCGPNADPRCLGRPARQGTCPQDCDNEILLDRNKTFHLFNGRNAEIKIMPETASATAIERLGELGFNISLKEVGDDKVVYELTAEKEGKMLGLFKVKGKVSVEVDAETGEVVKVRKPWWAFLASGI